MIFTIRNMKCSLRVFDANGDEIRYVLQADDVTGECIVLRTRSDRKHCPIVTRNGELAKRRIICKPPLNIIDEFMPMSRN